MVEEREERMQKAIDGYPVGLDEREGVGFCYSTGMTGRRRETGRTRATGKKRVSAGGALRS